MDFKRIRSTQSKADRIKEVDEQIKQAEKDPDFKLSDVIYNFAMGGSHVLKPLQDRFDNRQFDKTFFFQILERPSEFPEGKFLANLGDKEKKLDYRTGEWKNITTRDKNAMRKAFQLSKDPEDHYIKFDVLEIDHNDCVKCDLKSAISLIMLHTDLFDSTRKHTIVKELSESDFRDFAKKKTRKTSNTPSE